MSGYHYLAVELNTVFEEPAELDIFELKGIITENLKELFGEYGSRCQVDVLKYERVAGRIVLRCPVDRYVKVRSSLSLVSASKENRPLTFRVKKHGRCLVSLLSDSRTLEGLGNGNVLVQKGR